MKTKKDRTGSGGGAAGQAGYNFHNRVVAWLAARALAERSASPIIASPPTHINSETQQPVDDIFVAGSFSDSAFLQVKRGLSLSKRPKSGLASAFAQFVRQYRKAKSDDLATADRRLDPTNHGFVLAVDRGSSSLITKHLRNVLSRIPGLLAGQAPISAAVNRKEREAITTTIDALRRSWHVEANEEISESDLRALLELIRVAVLELEPDGSDEREAKTLLSAIVVRDPNRTDSAWSELIKLAANLGERRAAVNRQQIQKALGDAGIAVKGTPSYGTDIERLRQISSQTLRLLRHQSYLALLGEQIKVVRRAVMEIRRHAESASLLVVGVPGAGKTGCLHDLALSLSSSGRDVIFLSAEELRGATLHEIRSTLGLEHDFVDILENWPGADPAFLIIDALDALRGETTADALLKLIGLVTEPGTRWRVVASIRKYDLRNSSELKRSFNKPIFPALPAPFVEGEFSFVRHVNVPIFTENEVAFIRQQSSALNALFDLASPDLQELLRVPFNLRLMTEMVNAGASFEDLTPIRTQVELLERYWTERVLGLEIADLREAVLRRVCGAMVAGRILRVERAGVFDPSLSSAFGDLLSSQVIAEWQSSPSALPARDYIVFSHHLLFDFAVCRLYVPADSNRLIELVGSNPDIVIVVRPSIVMRFQQLWIGNRKQFWELLFEFSNNDRVPPIGKIIGPTILVDLARGPADFEPFVSESRNLNGSNRLRAQNAFSFFIRAALTEPFQTDPVRVETYCKLLDEMTKFPSLQIAASAQSLLNTIIEWDQPLTKDAMQAAGRTARGLLGYAWGLKDYEWWLSIHGLRSVCWTIASNVDASAALLRRSLIPDHLAKHGHEEIRWISRQVPRLLCFVPQFVAELYIATFSHEEVSEEKTAIGQSRIFLMTSTRRQDFQQAQWQLAQYFPLLVTHWPKLAAGVLIGVIESYTQREHSTTNLEDRSFSLRGHKAILRSDYSCIWDRSFSRHDENEIQLLDAFWRRLEELAVDTPQGALVEELLDIVIRVNTSAVVWKRLIELGTRQPLSVGSLIREVAWTPPLITAPDTDEEAAEFIRAIHPTVDHGERGKIEDAILSLTDNVTGNALRVAKYHQNRAVRALSPENIVDERARLLVEEIIRAESEVTRNAGSAGSRWLNGEGTPSESSHYGGDAEISILSRPIEDFRARFLNEVPSTAEIENLIPVAREVWARLKNNQAIDISTDTTNKVSGLLASACAAITKWPEFSCGTTSGLLVKEILLELSTYPLPKPDEENQASFDRFPSWPSDQARIDSATGVANLAFYSSCVGPDILDAIQRLACDPSPEVRFQMATSLHQLHKTAPIQMWELLASRMAAETSNAVLARLVDTAYNLATISAEKAIALIIEAFNRIPNDEGRETVEEICIRSLAVIHARGHHEKAREILLDLCEATPTRAGRILFPLRSALTHGEIGDRISDGIRARAIELVDRLSSSACSKFEAALRHSEGHSEATSTPDELQGLAKLIDNISHELYFASGVFKGSASDEPSISNDRQRRFYQETHTISRQLAAIGLPSATHHLIEMLEAFVPFNPREVFVDVALLVKAGRRGGYEYEHLGVDIVVRIVQRYLAEFRGLLQKDLECMAALRETLDIFVQAGWPPAQRLCFQLAEIYR